MATTQRILRVRRRYNQWVANQTLEDFALRFTALSARKWSSARVANTALGAISFLALEAIGGAITLSYGFTNAVAAILVVSVLIFLTGVPISYYAARYGVDIDLLSRGAGFGYIGSTITSLIYASFTFIFFAIEAAILATALELFVGLPLPLGYLVSAVVIIPLVTHGITFISRFQLWTQPIWVILNLLPFIFIALHSSHYFDGWTQYAGTAPDSSGGFNILLFGAAASVIFALIAQIGEQVDFLRFMPERQPDNQRSWWASLLLAGPGWIVLGCIKMLAGSFLAYLAISSMIPAEDASDPAHMYLLGFNQVFQSQQLALIVTGVFIVLSQLKINVTNAYAGSIAWSNFFSRLTHSHPGRVIWLVFNVIIALILMELGIYKALENILGLYAIVAVAWVGALAADLLINKPMGWSPPHIEFKRAHLYDVNPVGVGAMLLAILSALCAYGGLFGATLQALTSFVALGTAMLSAPLIAILTKGRFYFARTPAFTPDQHESRTCCICENSFEVSDIAQCPAYGGTICSLCCSLDARCHDRCKLNARFPDQILGLLKAILPRHWVANLNSRIGHYLGLLLLVATVVSAVLMSIYLLASGDPVISNEAAADLLITVFVVFMIIYGVAAWLFVLASESRRVAQEESDRQNELLIREISAHKRTDGKLQLAKEQAETANLAKSRYVVGLAHEFRTPLNAIYGYAQLLEKCNDLPPHRSNAVTTIRRSAEHLSELINGLLDIAQIESGRIHINRDEFSISTFLDDLADMFRLQCTAKRISFSYERPPNLPATVCADEKRLRQILINLLSNALKFTVQGGVILRVRYRAQIAEVEVEDTGIGIPNEDQTRIFLPFERINAPSAQRAKGTGLGLPIAKLLAEIMGGELTMNSEVGKGTIMKLKLFLPSTTHSGDMPQVEHSITGFHGESKVVLVTDDEPIHRALIEEMLTPLGFKVLSASDGPSCLRLAAQVPPDIFLLDVAMPGIDGWELARRLRLSGFKDVPIVMISGNAIGLENEIAGPPQHDAYLIKPIQQRRLLSTLEAQLGLQWIHVDRQHHNVQIMDVAESLSEQGCQLPNSVKRELKRLCDIGHVRALQSKLSELDSRHPEAKLCLTRLRRHIDAFEIDQFLSVLGTCDD